MGTTRLEGKPVAEGILAESRGRVARGRAQGRPVPVLASVHRGGPTPFSVYLRNQEKRATDVGLGFRPIALPPGARAPDVAAALTALDGDRDVHAVLLEHPLPPELGFGDAIARLRPEKDVDGVGVANVGHLVGGAPIQVPAVALGALAIARHYRLPLAGARVAVVGRSASVGIPLALLLLARGADATVTVAHSKTRDLGRALDGSELIFSCAGQPGLLTRSNVPEGAAVVDVGLTTVPDATAASGHRSVGDADPASLDGWASALAPVPGGVGPVTVARLMANAVHGWELLTGGP